MIRDKTYKCRTNNRISIYGYTVKPEGSNLEEMPVMALSLKGCPVIFIRF